MKTLYYIRANTIYYFRNWNCYIFCFVFLNDVKMFQHCILLEQLVVSLLNYFQATLHPPWAAASILVEWFPSSANNTLFFLGCNFCCKNSTPTVNHKVILIMNFMIWAMHNFSIILMYHLKYKKLLLCIFIFI